MKKNYSFVKKSHLLSFLFNNGKFYTKTVMRKFGSFALPNNMYDKKQESSHKKTLYFSPLFSLEDSLCVELSKVLHVIDGVVTLE